MKAIRIEEIDQNLQVQSSIGKEDIVWLSPKCAPFSLHGLCETEMDAPYHRLPEAVGQATNQGVNNLRWHTAGGRVRFSTDSPYVAIKAVMPATTTMAHMAKTGQSGFDLYASDGTNTQYVGTFVPPTGVTSGYESCLHVPGGMRTYTIHMPLYDGVAELYIGLARTAAIAPADSYLHTRPVVYYGSSITQGGCASRPGNAYQAIIARMLDADFINLGFSGSARGEEAIAKYIATLSASVFVLDYDHNAPSTEHLRATHLPFYRIYREVNPDVPIVLVSRPNFGGGDSLERRAVIYDTWRTAIREGDRHIAFVDGETLFAGDFRDSCTVDGCHPNDLGFFRMAEGIGRAVERFL